jgi:hypothetical protein
MNEPLWRFCDRCRVFTEWLSEVDGSCICSACDGRALGDMERLGIVQHDGALIEYQQQLWRTLAQVKNIEDRRSLLYVLERTTTGGRAALYDMVEGCDSWPPPAPRDDPKRHSLRR